MNEKPTYRRHALAVRKAMSATQRDAASRTITDALSRMFKARGITTIAAYYPMRGELDMVALKADFTLFLPKVIDGRIAFYQDTGDYTEGNFNTTVPAHDDQTDLGEIDAVIVPGLCYDKQGYRVGYGKGYYDDLLSRYEGMSVGVCYADLVFDSLPIQPHDRAVDVLLTERGTMKG